MGEMALRGPLRRSAETRPPTPHSRLQLQKSTAPAARSIFVPFKEHRTSDRETDHEGRRVKDGSVISLQGIALNAAGDSDGSAPEWVQLTPAGPRLIGIDGRAWTMTDPDAVVDRFRAINQTLPVDVSHSTEIKAPKGEPAPAVGHIHEMENRDGEIWAKVEWNAAGEAAVAGRAYRYVSPAFLFTKAKQVVRLTSVGLVNKPNFQMAALNQADPTEEDDMSLAAIRTALNLAEDADESAILSAINSRQTEHETALNAAKAAAPDLAQYVPMATHQSALNRANEAEGKLSAMEAEGQEVAINTAVDAAIEEKKVAPADRDFYIASCKAEGGLERFKAFAKSTPVIAGDTGLDGRKPEGAAGALTEDQIAACRAMGVFPEEFQAANAAEAKGA